MHTGPVLRIDASVAGRLYRRAAAERWGVSQAAFTAALERTATAMGSGRLDQASLECALELLHLQDLALACACAEGHEAAWEHFVLEYRPTLYRAASAIDQSGRARELADSLYGELFGLKERGGARQSLFVYFHGRSSLGTWLRAILAQRHVDRVRVDRRHEPLSEDDPPPAPPSSPESDRDRRRFASMIAAALAAAVARLAPRDRLRLAWYYAQDMTLASIGRVLKEHEATVSRHLSRTRKVLRDDVEAQLRLHGLRDMDIAECFASVAEDPRTVDLRVVLGGDGRKDPPLDRSTSEGMP